MNLDLLSEREIEDLFGWPSCPEPAPWAHLCEHATPDADDIARADDEARAQP